MRLPFTDRTEAGRLLGERLARMGLGADAVVLALPRGGVPVGYEVARALRAALDVFVVRKLGVPGHEELAMGAIATGGVRVVNDSVTHVLGVPDHVIDRVAEEELRELERREAAYRGRRAPPDVRGRDAILVDDGLATGATMRAAIQAVRVNDPARVIVAVPVAPWEACSELRSVADEMVCLETPEPFQAVGLWYSDFTPPTDDEIRDMLAQAGGPQR
jgi:putative phosphoribosyl transferase